MKNYKQQIKEYKEEITGKITSTVIRALGRDTHTIDGFRPYLGIVDEYHAHKDNQMYKLLKGGTRKLKQNGVTIIYISHRLEEIFELSDRVTVLRDGEYVTTLNTAETNKDELVKYMVGRQLTEIYPERSKDCIKEEVVRYSSVSFKRIR